MPSSRDLTPDPPEGRDAEAPAGPHALQGAATPQCPTCGAVARGGIRYCQECGTAIPVRCPGCGAPAQSDKRFCGSCGEPLRSHRAHEATEQRQASVIALVGPRITEGSRLGGALDELARELGGVVVPLPTGRACVFGAPRSLEDHLERAILAALRLRDDGELSSASCGVGIASGRLAAAESAWTDSAITSGPISEATALAGAAAPGELIVDASLLPLLPDTCATAPADDADVAGSGTLYRVAAMTRARQAGRPRQGRPLSRFVGRERQLRSFDDALTLVESGAGQVMGFVAEPGMGKSRLLEEARRASAQRVRWIEARCSPYGASHPYLPVLELVRRLCDEPQLDRADVGAAIRRTFIHLEAPLGGEPYVRHLLGELEPYETRLLVAGLSPEAVRLRTFEALRHLLLAAARREPLAVAIEDVHWADDTSERFLASLASALAGARILMVATYRPGYRPTWLELSHATQIALPRLGPSDSLEVVHSVLEADELPEALGRAILARGEGNPFFLEELALAGPASGDEDEVPRTVEDVLMARIDRLDDEPRAVLQAAAVLGRRFSLRLLSAVWPRAGPVRSALQDLVREEFLVEAVVDGDGGYEFRHALTQDVAYRSLSPPGRRALHESAGLSLEGLYVGRTEEVDGLLAHHWSRTDDAVRAVAYLQRAAERSSRAYAHHEAGAMLREAIRHAERLPPSERERRIVELSLRLIASLYFLGRMDESEQALADLAPRVGGLQNPGLSSAYNFWAAHTASHTGKPDDAERSARASIDLAEQMHDDAALGRALYIRVRQGWWTGRFEEGVREGAKAIPLLERAGDTWWLGHCHFFIAHSLYSMGRFDDAIEAAARGGGIGDAVADPRLRSWAAWARGLYEAARGDTDVGLSECARGLELSPDEPNTAWALGALGFARRERGDLEPAIADLERAIAIAEGTSHPGIRARFLGWLAEARRRAGDITAARDAAIGSGDIAQRIGCPWVVALALRTRGRIALDERDLPAARRLLQDARIRLQAIGCEFDLALCQMDLASLAARESRDPGPAMASAARLLEGIRAPAHRERLGILARELGLSDDDPAGLVRLTPREREVLGLIAQGLTNRQIAQRLVISEGTAIRHVSNIFGKLGVSNRSAATRSALDHGLVTRDANDPAPRPYKGGRRQSPGTPRM